MINQVAKAKAAEMEEQQGFAPGKKAMKELKERVADELLPRAFSIRGNVFTWIDPVNGWLGVDAASPNKADDVIKLLLKGIDKMPLESLRVQSSPVAMMTTWLETDEAPYNFTASLGPGGTLVEKPDSRLSRFAGERSAPDGFVDLRDFRRFRDAWLAGCTDAPEAQRDDA